MPTIIGGAIKGSAGTHKKVRIRVVTVSSTLKVIKDAFGPAARAMRKLPDSTVARGTACTCRPEQVASMNNQTKWICSVGNTVRELVKHVVGERVVRVRNKFEDRATAIFIGAAVRGASENGYSKEIAMLINR